MPSLQFAEGFILGAALLVALGPKDTFVIRNSVQGDNALLLVLICSLSDLLLISLGVLGLGAVITHHRWLMMLTMTVSIIYLVFYGGQAAFAAFRGITPVGAGDVTSAPALPRGQVIRGALFHSLLTPFAWLDTVLVIGSISATKIGLAKYAFAGGAVTASFLWFVFLTLGSRIAAPLFRVKRVWVALDVIVATSMFLLAAKLLADYPWLAGETP
jgi:L-lysine exporter family protein LysE/ArgO